MCLLTTPSVYSENFSSVQIPTINTHKSSTQYSEYIFKMLNTF